MPSASPLYTFSNVFSEPETPSVLHHNGSNKETNSNNINHRNSSSNNNSVGIGYENGGLVNGSMPTAESFESSGYTYDPFKFLSAMAEQSLTGNFTHSSALSRLSDSSRGNNCSSSVATNSNNVININSAFINVNHHIQYQPCDRNMYSAVSTSSISSFASPPLSPTSSSSSSSSHCISAPAENMMPAVDYASNDISRDHKTSPGSEIQSHDFVRNNPFSQAAPAGQSLARGDVSGVRSICKKSYPSCSSEQALDESDRLLSWTLQHPEGWSNSEVLDWVFFVAQERELDMQEFRGENFRAYTGAQLCQMGLEDFTRLEPKFGKIIYEMFRKLLCGVVFHKPTDPDQLTSSCIQMSPYSPVLSPKMSHGVQCFSPTSHQLSETEINDCNGVPQNTFFKQEQCSNVDNAGIDITSYDFDLDDPPCIPTSQCQEQYHAEYGTCSSQYSQTMNIRSSCCFPTPPYPVQIPRRRPGRPRVKSLMDDDRMSKEKKVKNQHLWEFIYETLMNPMYNPQYLRWENQRDGVFRFVQSEAVAQLWGGRKNNENMTYEKLSRAMRHYYRRGILERVEGRRLVYKFSQKAMERVREKRNTI